MKGDLQMSRIQGKTPSRQLAKEQVFVGIDVSKLHLDIHLHPIGLKQGVTNDRIGLKALARLLKLYSVSSIIMEATGRYHRLAHRHLFDAGFPVAAMNPYQTRRFADMLGQLAKTDAIGAQTLALFGEMVRPATKEPPSPSMTKLTALLVARRQVKDQCKALLNQLENADPGIVTRQIRARLKMGHRHLGALETEIEATIDADPCLKDRYSILVSIPGIGLIIAATLIAELSELGTLNAQKIAALVGVAPMNVDSGTMRGQRKILAGRKTVRNTLYMAAVSAIRCNPDMARFYQRLKETGKPYKVAITAIIRKLAILANSLIAQNRTWQSTPPRRVNHLQEHLS